MATNLNDVAAAILQPAPTPTDQAEAAPEDEDQGEVTTQADEADASGDEGSDDEVLEVLTDGEEGDDSDDDAEEEPTGDEDEDGDEEAYLLTLDGEEVEVTLDDLIKSYQVQGTAQKRLQEASEARNRAVEEGRQEGMAQAKTQIVEQTQALEQQRQQLGVALL